MSTNLVISLYDTAIMFKLAVITLVVVSVAQVLASPVAPHVKKHDVAPVRLNKLQLEGKGLIGDILAAEKAITEFINSCDHLYYQVLTSKTNVVNTLVSTTNTVIAQLKELGVNPDDIAAIEAAANACVANIEGIVQGLLNDITTITSLLGDILTHLDNPVQLYQDIIELGNAIERLEVDFSSAFDRVIAELVSLKNTVVNVIIYEPIEIVNNIMNIINSAESAIIGEYNTVIAALRACLDAGAAALAALNAIIS